MTPEGPGRGFGSTLICLCELSVNKTYCPHTEGICPWWDKEPIDPKWERVDEPR